jgi:ferredoxin
MLRVVADRERCVGGGLCLLAAPAVFDQSENDGRVLVLIDAPDRDDEDAVRAAVAVCPARALSLHVE